jgi:hypothetical protein
MSGRSRRPSTRRGGCPMAFNSNVILIMIVSPGDVIAERDAARDVIHDWNNIHADENSAVLLPIGWDTHTSPELGMPAQQLINERVLARSDLLVAIFGHRVGKRTAGYLSGSVEEIQRHLGANKPVMVYFSDAPPGHDADEGQLALLRQFRDWCTENGLKGSYTNSVDFERTFDRELRIALQTNPYLKGLVGAITTLGDVGTPSVVRAPAGSSLLEESRQLLVEASLDPSGVIVHSVTLGGNAITTNRKEFGDATARSVAKWKRALEELESNDFIKAMGPKREIFEVTDRGYELADRLRAAV